MTRKAAVLVFVIPLLSMVSAAKVNVEDFNQTAIVKEVTSEHEPTKVSSGGKVRYKTRFTLVTEIGGKVYDLGSPQRIELGTYRAKIDNGKNRVQFLLQDKDGNPKSSAWYEIVGERQK